MFLSDPRASLLGFLCLWAILTCSGRCRLRLSRLRRFFNPRSLGASSRASCERWAGDCYFMYPSSFPIQLIAGCNDVFSFIDDNEQITLRYDLSSPLSRFVAQNYRDLAFPFKRYAIGNVWRNEKSGNARYREFTQADLAWIAHVKTFLRFDHKNTSERNCYYLCGN